MVCGNFVCSRGCLPEFLNVETGEVVSNAVIHSRDVCNTLVMVAPGCQEEQLMNQGHEVWTLARTLLPYSHDRRIIAVEEYTSLHPVTAPGGAGYQDNIEFLPRDGVVGLLGEPCCIKPPPGSVGSVACIGGINV